MQKTPNNKLLLAKIEDKILISKTKNKICNTTFFNEFEIKFIEKEISKSEKYIFTGGYKEATRKIFITYPDKINEDIIIENINKIIVTIKIELPNQIKGKFEHKNYLGMLMNFGLNRERIGDIIAYEDKCYIVVLKENAQYIKDSLQQEKKLKKAKIEIIDIKEIEPKADEYDEININVNSLRLDNIVAEILKISRSNAQKAIEEERVFINYIQETKNTRLIKENDTLVIRKNGKYIINEFLGENKKRKANNKNKKI